MASAFKHVYLGLAGEIAVMAPGARMQLGEDPVPLMMIGDQVVPGVSRDGAVQDSNALPLRVVAGLVELDLPTHAIPLQPGQIITKDTSLTL